MSKEQQRYLSYLVRLWPSDKDGHIVWRASIENATNGERLGFTDLATLSAYLRDQAKVIGDSLLQKGGRRMRSLASYGDGTVKSANVAKK